MDDFLRSIGDGISGLVGGALNVLSAAFDAAVAAGQAMLPGPLFAITVVGVIAFAAWWLFKR